MLLFSTLLKISRTMTKESFVRLVIEWNQTSQFENNIIPGIQWNGSFSCGYGSEKLWLAIEEYRPGNMIAVRYEKQEDDGSVWDTDYVMNFDSMIMSVRLDRSYTAEALAPDPKFSTPYFITLLDKKGYLQEDSGLPVTRKPVMITDDDLKILSGLVNGDTSYRLPVVYVSKTFDNEDPVNVLLLASRLKGAAHVLVQEDTGSGYRIRELCDSRNEYNGGVGIYFPNRSVGHKRYLPHVTDGYDDRLMEKVIMTVIQYCNSRMTEPLYTWQGVSNAVLMERFIAQRKSRMDAEAARKKAEEAAAYLLNSLDEEERRIRKQAADEAEAQANRILDGFDNEMQYLQDQIRDLTKANEILQYENQGLKSKLDTVSSVPVLCMGEESEFYPGEIRDLVLLVLSETVGSAGDNTRRNDVIRDLVEANDYQKVTRKRTEEVKRLLKSYEGMTGPLKQALMDMGFSVSEEGKHCKLTYYGDSRYQVILSKTPSDIRTGKNSAQKIIKTVF